MRRILTALILCFPAIAWAGDDAAAVTRIADLAFQVITPIVVILATWLAHRLIKVFEARTGIDIPDAQEALVDGWVDHGIHYAAEKSLKKVKEGTDKLTGPEKLEEAADFVLAFVESRKWVDWSREKIEKKVEAALNIKRDAE